MRIWGKTFADGQKLREAIVELPIKKVTQLAANETLIIEKLTELTRELDLERPNFLGKHKRELTGFGRCVFLPSDFIETVDFERFVVEIIPDE